MPIPVNHSETLWNHVKLETSSTYITLLVHASTLQNSSGCLAFFPLLLASSIIAALRTGSPRFGPVVGWRVKRGERQLYAVNHPSYYIGSYRLIIIYDYINISNICHMHFPTASVVNSQYFTTLLRFWDTSGRLPSMCPHRQNYINTGLTRTLPGHPSSFDLLCDSFQTYFIRQQTKGSHLQPSHITSNNHHKTGLPGRMYNVKQTKNSYNWVQQVLLYGTDLPCHQSVTSTSGHSAFPQCVCHHPQKNKSYTICIHMDWSEFCLRGLTAKIQSNKFRKVQ